MLISVVWSLFHLCMHLIHERLFHTVDFFLNLDIFFGAVAIMIFFGFSVLIYMSAGWV